MQFFARIFGYGRRPTSFLHVWKHDKGLSDFQVWTAYRIVTKHLNLYYTGRPTDTSCHVLQVCHEVPETSLCFRSARRHVRAEVNSSDIGLELLILLVSFLDVSATVPIVRVLKYQRFTGLDDWRGFKMMSRRRTGVAMDMVPDVLCLHHALLV